MKGINPKLYLANARLCDFSMSKELFHFRTPSVIPELSNLRKPLQVDWETVRRMFVVDHEPGNVTFDLERARELFVPNVPWFADDEEEPYDYDEDWERLEVFGA